MNRLVDRETRLREAVERGYQVFRRYRLPETIEPDPCFPSFCDDRPLRLLPLRELPPEAFEKYLWKAISTFGTVDDFKHFLPRLLDLLATRPRGFGSADLDPYLVFAKIAYGEWRRWMVVEREAVSGYVSALWDTLVARPTEPYQHLTQWLRDFTEISLDLDPLLAVWEADIRDEEVGPSAAMHLARAILDLHHTLATTGRLDWIRRESQEFLLLRWLSSQTTSELLEMAFFRTPDGPTGERLSLAADMQFLWPKLVHWPD